MTTVRALIDSVNELAQVPLRAGSRMWGGRASVAAVPAAPGPPDLRYAHGNLEPPLDELLGDPLVGLVMRADRLDPGEVRRELHPRPSAALPRS